MKFTLSWLKEHLETDASLDEIVAKLTAIGLELEDLERPADKYQGFKVAEVAEAVPHPDADKLRICQVNDGSGTLRQVICGAPNARAGIKVVLATPGTVMPLPDGEGNPITIKIGKIRGTESQGMMCSNAEMGMGDDHDGIIELLADAPVGQDFIAYRKDLDDPVIEINVTPNRPDALGVRGVARDLAAAGLGRLKPNRARFSGATLGASGLDVRIETPENCPAFAYRVIRGVKNGPSPIWMQKKLEAIGLRPISALVDVTNWMTFDQARPMHVFDAGKVSGDLVVRLAKPGEELLALDEKTYRFDEQMTVIADDKGVESIAGIMGGEESGCSDDTVDVVVEAALWNSVNIARTGRKLQVNSDARYRFERGVDPTTTIEGMEIATQYILDICGGQASDLVVAGEIPSACKVLDFDYGLVASHGGLDLPRDQGIAILQRLGFEVSGDGNALKIRVPLSRPDIDRQWDFVEEILRIHGYDQIPAVSLPRASVFPALALNEQQRKRSAAKRAMAARGMHECVTWSFTASEVTPLFGGGLQELRIANPIISELDEMRPSLLINLLMAVARNANRSFASVNLFEQGSIFTNVTPEGQHQAIAGVRSGQHHGKHWSGEGRTWDAFDAKADALAALEALGLATDNLQVASPAPGWYHPGRSGALMLGPKTVLAHFGELHPKALKALDVKGRAVGFEVFIDNLPKPKRKASTSRPAFSPSPFNPITRDFAFVVDAGVEAQSLIRAVKGADKALITDVQLFDVYQGQGMADGKKSLAITVTLQPTKASMTDEQIEEVSQKLIALVTKATGASLRA